MNSLLIWTLAYIFVILVLFYLLFKVIRTKNIKYAYAIGAMVLLMIGMLFI